MALSRRTLNRKAIAHIRSYLDDDEYPEGTVDLLLRDVTRSARQGDSDDLKIKTTAFYFFIVEGRT
jgi:hypothetical protein